MPDLSRALQPDQGQPATLLHLVDKAGLDGWLKGQPERARRQMIAEVVCSGWYCHPVSSDTTIPSRAASSSSATLALSSRSGQAG